MDDSLHGLKAYLKTYAKVVESRQQNCDVTEKEFQRIKQIALEDKKNLSSSEGAKEVNRKKNRYKDILPYDYTRVKLPKIDGEDGSDYINANSINDTYGNFCYIASQGPMPNTVNDFWRMVFHYQVKLVIMACKEMEMGRPRCERYWPYQSEPCQYNDITVSLLKEKKEKNLQIRELKAVKTGTFHQETHFITQLHYLDWPDHSAPETSETILNLIRIARDRQTEDDPPIVIHCSAGCGRTGAIIAIDLARKLIKAKSSKISPFDIVTHLRKQRPAMVQTQEQYEFLYEIIRELVTDELSLYDDSIGNDDSNPTYENIGYILEKEIHSLPLEQKSYLPEEPSMRRSQSESVFVEDPSPTSRRQIILPTEHLINADTAFRRSRSLHRIKDQPTNKKAPLVPRKASEGYIQFVPDPPKKPMKFQQQSDAGTKLNHPTVPPNKPKTLPKDQYFNLEHFPMPRKLNEEYIPAAKPETYSSYPKSAKPSNLPAPLKPQLIKPPKNIPSNTLLSSAAGKLGKQNDSKETNDSSIGLTKGTGDQPVKKFSNSKESSWSVAVSSSRTKTDTYSELLPVHRREVTSEHRNAEERIVTSTVPHTSHTSTYETVQHVEPQTTPKQLKLNPFNKIKQQLVKKTVKSPSDEQVVNDVSKQKFSEAINELDSLGYKKRIEHKFKGPQPQPVNWPKFPS